MNQGQGTSVCEGSIIRRGGAVQNYLSLTVGRVAPQAPTHGLEVVGCPVGRCYCSRAVVLLAAVVTPTGSSLGGGLGCRLHSKL